MDIKLTDKQKKLFVKFTGTKISESFKHFIILKDGLCATDGIAVAITKGVHNFSGADIGKFLKSDYSAILDEKYEGEGFHKIFNEEKKFNIFYDWQQLKKLLAVIPETYICISIKDKVVYLTSDTCNFKFGRTNVEQMEAVNFDKSRLKLVVDYMLALGIFGQYAYITEGGKFEIDVPDTFQYMLTPVNAPKITF